MAEWDVSMMSIVAAMAAVLQNSPKTLRFGSDGSSGSNGSDGCTMGNTFFPHCNEYEHYVDQ